MRWSFILVSHSNINVVMLFKVYMNKRQRVEYKNFLKLHCRRAPLLLLSVLQQHKSRGKAKIQLFPGKQPRLFSINYQSLQKSRETSPKRRLGTCAGLGAAWGACVRPSRPRLTRAPTAGEGGEPLSARRYEFKSR